MPQTFRSALADELSPLLPESWELAPFESTLSALDHTVLMLRYQGFELTAGDAPGGSYQHSFQVTVIVPTESDVDMADALLDDALESAMDAFNAVPWVLVSRADKQVFMDTYPCWDFTLTFYSPL